MNSQKTIKESIELEGVGLHNGLKVKLCIKPADVDTGIKFKRVDVEEYIVGMDCWVYGSYETVLVGTLNPPSLWFGLATLNWI